MPSGDRTETSRATSRGAVEGTHASSEVAETTRTVLAGVSPKKTPQSPGKPVPEIVTRVPGGPIDGETPVGRGSSPGTGRITPARFGVDTFARSETAVSPAAFPNRMT